MQVVALVADMQDDGLRQAIEAVQLLFVRLVGFGLEADFPAGVEDSLDARARGGGPGGFPDDGQRDRCAVVPRDGGDAGRRAV